VLNRYRGGRRKHHKKPNFRSLGKSSSRYQSDVSKDGDGMFTERTARSSQRRTLWLLVCRTGPGSKKKIALATRRRAMSLRHKNEELNEPILKSHSRGRDNARTAGTGRVQRQKEDVKGELLERVNAC